jgi:hypothetical protein
MSMRRGSIPILLVPLLLVPPAPPVQGATESFALKAGQAVFWRGPHIEESSGDEWDYRIRVAEKAFRLRIAIDHPKVYDLYEVEITDPEGQRSTISPGRGLYSAEHLVRNPALGTWRVRVRARDVDDSRFRMRAKLEASPPSLGTRRGLLLPNLQVLPAHEASFLFPVTNGSTDARPTGLDLKGAESCHPEERIEEGAIRCLRIAFGVRNTGRGPLDLHLGSGGAFQDRELIQRIHRADGSFVDRPAGVARYHKTHFHYHHDAAIGLRLFRVVDAGKGELEPAGEMQVKGFAHREELLRDWARFYPTTAVSGFGLGPGWADIYEWDRPGNYVDFGLNPDGLYVVRMWADPVGQIRESNEHDNLGYTLIEVMGDQVEVLETGRGRHPWDRCKIQVGPGGYPDPPRRPRPRSCPPDTT